MKIIEKMASAKKFSTSKEQEKAIKNFINNLSEDSDSDVGEDFESMSSDSDNGELHFLRFLLEKVAILYIFLKFWPNFTEHHTF